LPHIQFTEYTQPQLPLQTEDVFFEFVATNTKIPSEKLISVVVDQEQFLLQLKKRDNGYLIKSEKYTRPSVNDVLQRALRRFAKVTDAKVKFSNLSTKEHHHIQNSDSIVKPIEYFAENFPKGKEIWIEVGFGSGRHLLHKAKENPDILMIGIEIHKPSIEQVVKQVNIQNLQNVLLLDYDARLFLEFVPSNVVGRIFVHFPVPWDKKPHRRVISSGFIGESIRALLPDGELHLRTDSDNYFEYSLKTFLDLNRVDFSVRKNADIEVKSKYEDRWVKMQKNIYDITMRGGETSEEIEDIEKFEFEKRSVSFEKIEKLNNQTIRYENSFIHFQNLYMIDNKLLLLSLTMGNFERPEHIFIIASEEGAKYYANEPVRSKTNLFLHQQLKAHLYE